MGLKLRSFLPGSNAIFVLVIKSRFYDFFNILSEFN